MILFILFFCYFGQVYSCARTADSSTTTLAPGVTTTLAPGVTTTTIAGQTTTSVAGETTTTTTAGTTTTTTENRALTCMEPALGLQPQPNVPGTAPTADPIVVMNMANTVVINCVAMATAMTQISINNGQFILAPGPMASIMFTCSAEGQWTFPNPQGVPTVVTSASCNDV